MASEQSLVTSVVVTSLSDQHHQRASSSASANSLNSKNQASTKVDRQSVETSEPTIFVSKSKTNFSIVPQQPVTTTITGQSFSPKECNTEICNTEKAHQHLDSHVLVEELSLLSPETHESINGSFINMSTTHPVLKSFLVGSVSGTCSTVIFQPLDLLKTRLQNPEIKMGRTGNGMFTVVGHIVRDEKILGLWRGMTPSLTRCVPGVGLYFGSIHGLKLLFDIKSEPTALQAIALGATARSISGVTMIPFTVIKTRFESRVYQYGSIREALTLIYKKEGYRGLTCGLVPTLLRDAPFSALYLMMYTWTKKTVPKDWIESGTFSPYVRFSCGVVAGIGASLVTQPFDVVKTKMQLFPDKFHSVPPVLTYIYDKYGMTGYFKGLLPRMVRRTLIAALSWTVYEHLMRNIGLK